MKKKMFREKPRMCDPGMCENCTYIGEGDFICDHPAVCGKAPAAFVVEDWQPNENYLKCKRGGKRNGGQNKN